jgi:parallel beta-helix repeat protein
LIIVNKKILPIAFLMMLLLSTLTGAGLVSLTSANFIPPPPPELPRIYIRGNGVIEPNTAPIRNVGDTYTLTNNIVNFTIEIQRDNILLEGAGYTLSANFGPHGIVVSGRNNVTVENITIRYLGDAITISNSTGITVTGNKLAIDANGIVLISYSNNTISGNDLSGNYEGAGIICDGSYNTVEENNITLNTYGIKIQGALNTINENNIHDVYVSISLDADSNTISKNNLSAGNEGIEVGRVSNNIIFGNNITSQSLLGIAIDGFNNTLYENRVENNRWSVTLGSTESRADNNTFYHNDFVNNTLQIGKTWQEYGNNFWDNGKEGNYWSDYTTTYPNATEVDSSGKWNTPYVIDANNTDNYPLMAPFESSSLEPQPEPAPFPTVLIAAAFVIVVVVVGAGLLVYFRKRKLSQTLKNR